MAVTGIGLKAFLGIGNEVTYATPVARDKFIEILSESLVHNINQIEALTVSHVSIAEDDVSQGTIDPSGSIVFPVTLEGCERFFKNAFGGHSVAGTSDPYTHTFTLEDDLPTGLTLEINRDISSFIFSGCKVDTLELALGGPSEMFKGTATIFGSDVTTGTASSPTYNNLAKYIAPQVAITWGVDSVKAENLTVTLNNNLDKEMYVLGSRNRIEPVRNDKRRATGATRLYFDSLSQYTDFKNATSKKLEAIFTYSATRTLTLTAELARIKTYPINVGSMGKLMVDMTFECLSERIGSTLGTEKVSDGNFATGGAPWVYNVGWAWDAVNFEADHTAGNTDVLEQDISSVASETYQLVFTVKNLSAGNVTPKIGGVTGATVTANGTYTQRIVASNTGFLQFIPSSLFNGSIDDVSVKKVDLTAKRSLQLVLKNSLSSI